MDSSFISFSPKRKWKKNVHNNFTKLSLQYRGGSSDTAESPQYRLGANDKSERVLREMSSLFRCARKESNKHNPEFEDCTAKQPYKEECHTSRKENQSDSDYSDVTSSDGETSIIQCSDIGKKPVKSGISFSTRLGRGSVCRGDRKKSKIKCQKSIRKSMKDHSVIEISESSSDESSAVLTRSLKTMNDGRTKIVVLESDSSEINGHRPQFNGGSTVCKSPEPLKSLSLDNEKESAIKNWLQDIPVNSECQLPADNNTSYVRRRSRTKFSSSSASEDNFEEFLKSMKKKNDQFKQRLGTPASLKNFLTDGSVDNSPTFYLSLTNKLQTEEKMKIIAEKTKTLQEGAGQICTKALNFNESDAEFSDDVEEKKEEIIIKKEKTSVVNIVVSDTLSSSSEDECDVEEAGPPVADTKKIIPDKQKLPQRDENQTLKRSALEEKNNENRQQVCSFLASLSQSVPIAWCHPEAVAYKKDFKRKRNELCSRLFTLYNSKVFKKQLPSDLSITWNVRLVKTAGLCFNKINGKGRLSRIELSVKVCDSPDRLRDTLIHELCHAASWLIDGVKSGHGHHWKQWADTAMRCFPDIPHIKRCHDYKITTKFIYKCVQCGYSIGRHSKSLDLDRKRCGHCFGKFELFVNKQKNTTSTKETDQLQTPRTPSAFAMFVKQNYSSVKKGRSDLKHGEVMKLLGQQFAAVKISV